MLLLHLRIDPNRVVNSSSLKNGQINSCRAVGRNERFESSIELWQVDRVRARSARPAIECTLDDKSLKVLLTAVQLENVRPRFDVVRANTSTTEPADSHGALAAMPAVHQRLSAPPIFGGEVCIEASAREQMPNHLVKG